MEISWDLDKYVGAFNFRLSIDGILQENSKILSVSGVSSESKLVDDNTNSKTPLFGGGQVTLSEVEITRVYQGYDHLYNWRLMIEEGVDALRTVSIEILATDLNTVVRKITLHNCWPHKWQLPNLDASSTAPAIETISLAYERITGALGGASPGDAYEGGGTADGTGPLANSTASGDTLEDQAFGDDFWDTPSDLSEIEDKYATALELAAQASELFDPNEEVWDVPEAVDDPTAAQHGGDGSGPIIVGNAAGEKMEFEDTGGGTGPIGGRGEAEEAEYGEEGEAMDPNEEKWDGPEAVDDPTAAKVGGDGTGPIIVGNAAGETMEFEDTDDDGKPIDPNEVTDWGGSAAADDPTAAKVGGDGTGPIIVGNAAGEKMEFEESGDGTGPIGGRGEQNPFDSGDGSGPIDPSQKDFGESAAADDPTAGKQGGDGDGPIENEKVDYGGSAAADDPTAGKQGGDGSGPIGGRGAQAAFDSGEGSGPIGGRGAQDAADGGAGDGPIENEKVDYGGSAAADDPTAAKQGGGGSGPIGGRGAAAEADYGSPGSGPIGGRGEGGGGQTE